MKRKIIANSVDAGSNLSDILKSWVDLVRDSDNPETSINEEQTLAVRPSGAVIVTTYARGERTRMKYNTEHEFVKATYDYIVDSAYNDDDILEFIEAVESAISAGDGYIDMYLPS